MKIWIVPIIIIFFLLGVFVRAGKSVAETDAPRVEQSIETFKSRPLGLIHP